VRQVFKQLPERDVRCGFNTFDSTITIKTRKPSGKTDTDLPRRRRFTPALFHQWHFFRVIFSVGVLFLARPQISNGEKKSQ